MNGEYGWMPNEPCSWCHTRWPTRIQYTVVVDGPDGQAAARLCSQCWHRLVDSTESRKLHREVLRPALRAEVTVSEST